MVLRGQPVGEQGAADRWTALDPHPAGSGAGAPRGIPPAAPPFFLFLLPRHRNLDGAHWAAPPGAGSGTLNRLPFLGREKWEAFLCASILV